MSEEVTVTKTLDVCGKICPYPDMNTMTTLKKMAKGEVLEVLLDYPMSVERIPRTLKKQGHKLVSVEQIDGPNHRMLIEAFGLK
ncbi:MAG: sulfurtransferase TusA family protein [Anaerolineales bacterium]|nr:sulfurtransferase TusA family protein [Chloroflexota bacterium]MBL7163748.1 sulfurtransferase TusA family protein [Anaerolineales bacterium]